MDAAERDDWFKVRGQWRNKRGKVLGPFGVRQPNRGEQEAFFAYKNMLATIAAQPHRWFVLGGIWRDKAGSVLMDSGVARGPDAAEKKALEQYLAKSQFDRR